MTRRVAILGTAPSTRSDVPFGVEGLEFWGLNDAWKLPGYAEHCKTWFETHPRDWFTGANRPPDHLVWLQKYEGRLLMWQHFDDIPSSVAYPFEEMCKQFPGATGYSYVLMQGDKKMTHFEEPKGYMTSTIAYMMALAVSEMEAGDEIHMWGVDLAADTEYANQRPAVEYLSGVAQGRGIKVFVPRACPLLRGPFYGRPGDGNSRAEFHQVLEQEYYTLVNSKRGAEATLIQTKGALEVLERLKQRYAVR